MPAANASGTNSAAMVARSARERVWGMSLSFSFGSEKFITEKMSTVASRDMLRRQTGAPSAITIG
jgi:hypothetical protein